MTHCKTIITHLRNKGYRITPQREMIIQIIAHSEDHVSAEEVFGELQRRTQATNIATVYRSLEMLWEEGLACRNDLGEGHIVYATTQHGPHIHLICRNCNLITDATPEHLLSLQSKLVSNYDFKADLGHLSIFGVCKACQENHYAINITETKNDPQED